MSSYRKEGSYMFTISALGERVQRIFRPALLPEWQLQHCCLLQSIQPYPPLSGFEQSQDTSYDRIGSKNTPTR